MKLQILPSLLAADYGFLAKDIKLVKDSGSDAIHVDIMDPTFVPNMSFGPDIVALCRRVEPMLYRNVHLMMSRPDLYLDSFAKAGSQTIQIHVEASCDKHVAIRRIRELGIRPAIVVNPETPGDALDEYLDEVDEVLVMTVRPGYGGQKFIAECLEKVRRVRAMRPSMDVMVDGGVNGETAVASVAAGANMLVSGSYLFKQPDMAAAVANMRRSCEAATPSGGAAS